MDFAKIDDRIQVYGDKFNKAYVEPETNQNSTLDTQHTQVHTIVWYAQMIAAPSLLLFIIIKDFGISVFTKMFSIVIYLLFIVTLILNPTAKEIPLRTINNYTISTESKEKGQELLTNIAKVIKTKLL